MLGVTVVEGMCVNELCLMNWSFWGCISASEPVTPTVDKINNPCDCKWE